MRKKYKKAPTAPLLQVKKFDHVHGPVWIWIHGYGFGRGEVRGSQLNMIKRVCSGHMGTPSFCEQKDRQTRLKTLLLLFRNFIGDGRNKNTTFELNDDQVGGKLLLLRCPCFCLVSLIKTNKFVSGF